MLIYDALQPLTENILALARDLHGQHRASHPSCILPSLLFSTHIGVRFTQNGPVALQNAEIFTLTYGSMVRQLLTDLEDVTEVNKQLDKM